MDQHPALAAAGIADRCDILPVTKADDEAAWLAARASGIGASEAAAALNLSPYTSPMELYLLKTGQIPPVNMDENEAVYWGTVLEEPIAVRYGEKTKREIINPHAMYVLKSEPVLRVNPDRFDIDEHGQLGLVEVKMADSHLWEDWDDEGAPPWYQVQVAMQAHVTGIYRGRIACLIGGNRMVIREVDIDADLCQSIADRVLDWWNTHVVAGVMPPVDGSQSCTDALAKLWVPNGKRIALPAKAMQFIRDYKAAHAQIKHWEELKKQAGNELRVILGANTIGSWRDVDVVTWNEGETTRLDVKAHALADPHCHAANSKTTKNRTLRISDSKKAKALREAAA